MEFKEVYEMEGTYEISGWDILEETNEYIGSENLETIAEEIGKKIGGNLLAVVTFEDEPDTEEYEL